MSTTVQDAPPTDREKRLVIFAALFLIGLLVLQGLLFIAESSETSDEAAHLLAGYTYLTTGNFRPDREEPPLIKELSAFPLLFFGLERPVVDPEHGRGVFRLGPAFLHENRIDGDLILWLARLPILALSACLGWLIFRWGTELAGIRGALLPLALYVLDPNVVAHSCLVTTDLGVTFFVCLSIWAARKWAGRPSAATVVGVGLALGGALASKPTGFWAVPVLGVLALAARPRSARALALAALSVAGVAALVVVAVCGVVGVPDYLAGLGRGLSHSAAGSNAYLLGSISSEGWWYYFPFAFLVKTPPGTLVILFLAAAGAVLGLRMSGRNERTLGVPVAIILAVTCVFKVDIGLRHLLPIYPFVFLWASRLILPATGGRARVWRPRLVQGLVLACLAWNAFEAVAIAPHQLAYFNRFAGGPENGHRLLLDSNLDWGQSTRALRRFMLEKRLPMIYCAFTGGSDPRYYAVNYQYVPGIGNFTDTVRQDRLLPADAPRELLAVSAMALHFVRLGPGTLYDWLRDRPVVAMPGYSYLVYDITGDATAHLRLARLYEASALPVLAAVEAQRALRLAPDLEPARAILQRLAR